MRLVRHRALAANGKKALAIEKTLGPGVDDLVIHRGIGRITQARLSSFTNMSLAISGGIEFLLLGSVFAVNSSRLEKPSASGSCLKGGGGALTREKIVAHLAQSFICICDGSKQVDVMGKFPLPVEIIPMAHAQVARELEKLGGVVTLRKVKGTDSVYVTDNQGWILDVAGLSIKDPVGLESQINQIPGVVCNGLFARRKANVLLIGEAAGVRRQTY